jgi:hypothetical protein
MHIGVLRIGIENFKRIKKKPLNYLHQPPE